MSEYPGPFIHILLATYQGERYLSAQLDSISAQSHQAWSLTVSDDGSVDGTVSIVEAFASRHPAHRITLLKGPGRRSTANFFHLIQHPAETSPDDLYAFCDQDDVWLPEKLARAVAVLRAHALPRGLPQLYCARTQLVDEHLNPMGLSDAPGRPLAFSNALMQNVASGNTMVFNRSLLQLLKQVSPANSVWHDWTAYQVATACGGAALYDPEPVLLYRQHAANVIGASRSGWDQVKRIKLILRGQYREWGDKTELALMDLESQMTLSSRRDLERFRSMRRAGGPLRRCWAGLRSGLYRQTPAGQLGFLIALLLRLA